LSLSNCYAINEGRKDEFILLNKNIVIIIDRKIKRTVKKIVNTQIISSNILGLYFISGLKNYIITHDSTEVSLFDIRDSTKLSLLNDFEIDDIYYCENEYNPIHKKLTLFISGYDNERGCKNFIHPVIGKYEITLKLG
jgi:hypothetical protein